MTVLVTGSAGHLGEALMRSLRAEGRACRGVDILESDFTDAAGSIVDRDFVYEAMNGVEIVMHAATLHKPHVATHSRQDFIDVNVTGTQNLLVAAVSAGVRAFVFTSTTSAFGRALSPPAGAPAAWIDESVAGAPKNIYGVTKIAAENLCELASAKDGLPVIILRTSRFFPEDDDNKDVRAGYSSDNAKLNEFLHRRADIEDIVSAHAAAVEKAPSLRFARYIISATSPFTRDDLALLRADAAAALRRHIDFDDVYEKFGWRMFPSIDRVYANDRARAELGWRPRHDFRSMLARVAAGKPPASELAQIIGKKGYHAETFAEGPYPVD